MNNTSKVPSAFSYTEAESGEAQWGNDMNASAVAMVHTKLELDVQDRKSDELALILQNLDGMKDLSFSYVKECNGVPKYSPKKPDAIVTDYLQKIFRVVLQYIFDPKNFGLEEDDLQNMPVDIVFTVPVVSFEQRSYDRFKLTMSELVISRHEFYISCHYACWV
jgi:hypothetical protein